MTTTTLDPMVITHANGHHRPPPPPADPEPTANRLSAGWITLAVIIGVMAALIGLGGMALSFRSVRDEMIPAFGAWALLVPIVVDMTVFVFSGVDLILARMDMSHPLARWVVYGATGGTIYLNYTAGHDPAGKVAHVLMPAIWVVFVELMRHVVRTHVGLSGNTRRQPIPLGRWLLSPLPTFLLFRRMVLWQVNSYPRALARERTRLAAIATARHLAGRGWRRKAGPLLRMRIGLGEVDADAVASVLAPAPVVAEQPAPAPAPEPLPEPLPEPVAPEPTPAVSPRAVGTKASERQNAALDWVERKDVRLSPAGVFLTVGEVVGDRPSMQTLQSLPRNGWVTAGDEGRARLTPLGSALLENWRTSKPA